MQYKLKSLSSLTLAHVTGGGDDDYYYEDILELTDGDRSWTKVGQLKNGRYYFAVSVIEYKLYENKCK